MYGKVLFAFLNEVLSLNAQEFPSGGPHVLRMTALLNEVLSLNAQEFGGVFKTGIDTAILNEVLSLNAQEFRIRVELWEFVVSSMKS